MALFLLEVLLLAVVLLPLAAGLATTMPLDGLTAPGVSAAPLSTAPVGDYPVNLAAGTTLVPLAVVLLLPPATSAPAVLMTLVAGGSAMLAG